MTNRKRTVVGIDPGSTSALAILDLRGNLKELESGKHMGEEEIIRKVSEGGKPVLVTTDKQKLPSAVERVATSFGAEIFTPDEDLSIHGKKELTRKHDYENLHERDALAAALNAYNNFKDKFKNIESRMDDLNLQDLSEEVKEFVVTGEAKNVSEAVEIALGGDEEKDEEEDEIRTYDEEDLKEKIDNYRQIIMKERKDRKKLEEHNKKLKEEVKKLKRRASELKKERNELEKGEKEKVLEKTEVRKLERNLRSKENRIKRLENEKRELKAEVEKWKIYDELRKEGRIPLREVGKLTVQNLRSEDEEYKLKGCVLLIKDAGDDMDKILETLEKLGAEAVIGDMEEEVIDTFIEEGVWACSEESVSIKERDGVRYVDWEDFKEIKKEKKDSFIGWLKRYRGRDA